MENLMKKTRRESVIGTRFACAVINQPARIVQYAG